MNNAFDVTAHAEVHTAMPATSKFYLKNVARSSSLKSLDIRAAHILVSLPLRSSIISLVNRRGASECDEITKDVG